VLLVTFPQSTGPYLSSHAMAQTTTGAKAPKETPDASPAQAPTHARPRTAGRHHDAQLPTRSPSQCLHASSSLQLGTRLTHTVRPRRQAPPPRTHAGVQAPAAHPRRTRSPRTHERPEHACPCTHRASTRNKPVCILQPRARDAGNKILGWRIHESVEDTKLSTNKQHTLSRPVHMAWDREVQPSTPW